MGNYVQYFQKENIETLGIEPAKNVAEIAIQKGIPTEVNFFSNDLAKNYRKQI
ncbi:hypothetical protein ACT7DL_31610 [Bacillus paranthracis]